MVELFPIVNIAFEDVSHFSKATRMTIMTIRMGTTMEPWFVILFPDPYASKPPSECCESVRFGYKFIIFIEIYPSLYL